MNEKSTVPASVELADLRARLAGKHGREYWRSLEELAGTEEFQNYLHREFPQNASEWSDPAGRRNFLKLMAASLAFAGVTGCTRQPEEKIVPYVRAPEQFIPGKPLFYATAMTLSGYATGLLVESHMGRPTKVEGNPQHPASLGATDTFAQASILTMYDPDRSQVVNEAGRISTWSEFLAVATRAMQTQGTKQGAGLRILTETVTSPTLADQIRSLLKQYPEARWHQYEPVNRDNAHAGARLAFGEVVDTQYRFDKAKVVVSLEADFLCTGPGGVRYARDFSNARRVRSEQDRMNRLYVAESVPTNTGAMADHRLVARSSEIEAIAGELARLTGVAGVAPTPESATKAFLKWIGPAAEDLLRNRGASVVLAGESQPAVVHALAYAINAALGNAGNTVVYTDAVEPNPADQMGSLRELAADMDAGRVEVLLILGGNPVYTAPADVDFAGKMAKVPLRVHLGLYDDETSFLCHWHIPEAHYLESWGDARAFDGTVTIQQPLIAPLYGGKSVHEFLAALAGQPGRSGYDVLRAYWKAQSKSADFETFWRRTVHDGVMEGTALPAKNVSVRNGFASKPPDATPAGGIEVAFRPDASTYDGRFANNAWLQELPKSLTRLTWDNVAMVSPATAETLRVRNGDVLEIESGGRKLQAPAWVMPGQSDQSICVQLGYGRKRAGRVGTGIGYDTNAIRSATSPWFVTGAKVQGTGERYPLAVTQDHHSMEGRQLVREASLGEYKKDTHFVQKIAHDPSPELTLFPPHPYTGYAWGMAIDLNACVGCSSCVVACQAENNIPIVGKEQVARSREMHWLRIDRYFQGDLDNPKIYHQPVTCMQCENAPCEVVCPVAATSHSDEGLNDMTYNRCVGTRYCSNNCPYKVRRFNFLAYVDGTTPVLKVLRNPDVTVRSRGVMEKCTYCVQRINEARITSEKESRKIRDGEIQTACQQVCPTQAIIFGDINDKSSSVAKLKANSLNYGLLTELNTRPRTTYLAKLTNPNSDSSGE